MDLFVGIDPGGTNGVAVASPRYHNHDRLDLWKHTLQGYTLPREVCYLIRDLKPKVIWMERRASHSFSSAGLQPFEEFFATLPLLGYSLCQVSIPTYPTHPIFVLLSPGLWKPFVKAQKLEYGLWGPNSDHEQDAMGILYYGMTLAFPDWKVSFV